MKFDDIINNILKEEEISREDRIKALKVLGEPVVKKHYSAYENDVTFEDDFPQADVSKYLQDATSNEDLFILNGTATVGFDIEPGQNGGRDDPSWDPYPEINDVEWSDVTLLRAKSDGSVDVVLPETIGEDLYNQIVKELKVEADKQACEETEARAMDIVGDDFDEPDYD
jgi:hypothetical protein